MAQTEAHSYVRRTADSPHSDFTIARCSRRWPRASRKGRRMRQQWAQL